MRYEGVRYEGGMRVECRRGLGKRLGGRVRGWRKEGGGGKGEERK